MRRQTALLWKLKNIIGSRRQNRLSFLSRTTGIGILDPAGGFSEHDTASRETDSFDAAENGKAVFNGFSHICLKLNFFIGS